MSEAITELLSTMAALRAQCPWDQKQTHQSLVPYLLEEAYEAAAAIECTKGDEALKNELGDVLFQVIFHAHLAKERVAFDFDDIVVTLTQKLVRRHPHVFAGTQAGDDEQLAAQWQAIKAQEGNSDTQHDYLPALMQAQKIQREAAQVGFDWPDVQGALAKVREEIDELAHEVTVQDRQAIADELGDLLFACVNVARHVEVDAETVLRQASHKFSSRFSGVKAHFAALDKDMKSTHIDELEAVWQQVKKQLASNK